VSNVKIQGNASGSGTLTIQAPNTNTDRTFNLPDVAGDIVTTGDTGTVSTTMLADSGITTAKLADSGVTTAKLGAGIIQTAFHSTDAITYTTSQSGFTALEASYTPVLASHRCLVISNVYGAALDDAHAWLEYKIGTGSWTRNTELNGQYNSGMAMGDFSSIRSVSEPDQQTGFGTSVIWSPNTTETVSVRVICSAENTNGFALNIGTSRDTAASYNNTTSKSTLVLQEIV